VAQPPDGEELRPVPGRRDVGAERHHQPVAEAVPDGHYQRHRGQRKQACSCWQQQVRTAEEQQAIDRVFAFDEIAEAHRVMEDGGAVGKLVVRVQAETA